MTELDKTEAALLAEFSTYVSAITQSFSDPVRQALEEAERQMLIRIEEHQRTVHAADLMAEKALVARHELIQRELAAFGTEARSLRAFVTEAKTDLTNSIENFETTTLAGLQDVLRSEMVSLRLQVDALNALGTRNRRLLYAMLMIAVSTTIMLGFAWLRQHPW